MQNPAISLSVLFNDYVFHGRYLHILYALYMSVAIQDLFWSNHKHVLSFDLYDDYICMCRSLFTFLLDVVTIVIGSESRCGMHVACIYHTPMAYFAFYWFNFSFIWWFFTDFLVKVTCRDERDSGNARFAQHCFTFWTGSNWVHQQMFYKVLVVSIFNGWGILSQ